MGNADLIYLNLVIPTLPLEWATRVVQTKRTYKHLHWKKNNDFFKVKAQVIYRGNETWQWHRFFLVRYLFNLYPDFSYRALYKASNFHRLVPNCREWRLKNDENRDDADIDTILIKPQVLDKGHRSCFRCNTHEPIWKSPRSWSLLRIAPSNQSLTAYGTTKLLVDSGTSSSCSVDTEFLCVRFDRLISLS